MRLLVNRANMRWLAAILTVILTAFFLTVTSVRDVQMPPPKLQLSADRLTVGINYPWINYGQDIGATAWGHVGYSTPSTQAQLESDFANLSAMGIKLVRIFIFADGRGGILYDAAGKPVGLDQFASDDFAMLVKVAEKYHIYLLPVLFDFHFAKPAGQVQGVQIGGHANCIADDEFRRALLQNVVQPLVKQYAHNNVIAAWEVMNEPEWVTTISWGGGAKVPLQKMKQFVAETTALIHAHSDQPVTVGSARAKWVHYWTGLGLDFYQFHWYPSLEIRKLPNVTAGDLRLDKPVLLGEFATNISTPTAAYLNAAEQHGYIGALGWSYRLKDKASDFSKAAPDLTNWLKAAHP